jgi:ABC-2 type transport system permease protein
MTARAAAATRRRSPDLEMARVTVRQLLTRRRTILIVLLALVPILLSVIYRVGDPNRDVGSLRDWTSGIFDALVSTTLVPLIALLFGTAALGSEIDDGTVIYVLAKPLARWRVIADKFAVAGGLAALLSLLSTVPTVVIGLAGAPDVVQLVLGYSLAAIVGAFAYTSVFLALSLLTGRALILGLGYVLIWEGAIASLLPGTRLLSIHQYMIGVAALGDGREVAVPASSAAPLAVLAIVLALGVAVRRLRSFELGRAD